MSDLISRKMVLRCIEESRENIDWGQSEDGDAFLHYSAALYRTIASEECLPSEQPGWIPCDEALPVDDERVLCCTANKKGQTNIIIGYHWDGGWACGMNSNVIAWQPLPEPYQKEEA